MLATLQNDLFGFSEAINKPRLLAWKNCACWGCKMDNCNSEYSVYEIMLTKKINSVELLIWNNEKKDGVGEMVLEKTFNNHQAARDYAETWAETKAI